jgi:hypothetical protein
MSNKKLLNEIDSIKSIMGLITEDQEMASQASDLSKVQNLANLENVKVDVKKYLDKTNPICEPPKTGNEEHDNIIKKIWDWAHDPANKGSLKDTLKKVKQAYVNAKKEKKQEVSEQGGAGLVIAGITLTPSLLIAVGIFIIVIIIICSIPKKSSCKKWKTIDDLV